jgi:predicted nucleic acid-binding protein
MIVIADTSVLLNLALVGQLQLLQSLFGSVIIPLAVQTEFERLAATSGRFAGMTLPDWVQMKSLQQTSLLDETFKMLDPGEAAAINLAIELHADAVLKDESEGRAIAMAHGLRTIGIVGILIRARHAGHLAAIRPGIEDLLIKARFRLSDALVRHALSACQE